MSTRLHLATISIAMAAGFLAVAIPKPTACVARQDLVRALDLPANYLSRFDHDVRQVIFVHPTVSSLMVSIYFDFFGCMTRIGITPIGDLRGA